MLKFSKKRKKILIRILLIRIISEIGNIDELKSESLLIKIKNLEAQLADTLARITALEDK